MNKKRIPKATRKRLKLLRKVYLRKVYRPHFGPWLPDDHPLAIERRRAMFRSFGDQMIAQVSAPNQMLEHLRKMGRAS